MTDEARPEEWPRLMCVLCGLIVIFNAHGSKYSWPSRCSANAGAEHVDPQSPAATLAIELRRTWLRGVE